MKKMLTIETINRYKSNRGEIWETSEGLHFTFSEDLRKAGRVWKQLQTRQVA